jgi:hypothetical protein
MRNHLATRFLRLSAAERALVLRAAAALVLVRPSVGVFGLPVVLRCIERSASGCRRPESIHQTNPTYQAHETRIEPNRIVWLVEAAATHLRLPATCLTRSLVAAWLLGRHDHAATLSIGVNTDTPGTFAAHAWVTHHGHVLGPTASTEYTTLSTTTINASGAQI